jgi:glycosyltransferase involved in cell wall biosynthesis
VKINLVQRHGIPNDKIDVVHEFVPSFDKIGAATNTASLRKSLGIPKDVFIVGGSGYETWRKGKDLFIQLAINVFNRSNDLPIYFVWIGGSKKGSDIYQLQHDIRKAGLTDRIFLVPEVSNPLDYFATFDIFAMVSREDPFPLVNLEAASLGKPIICFEQAGGSQEFVEDDAGFVVPYLDLVAMADKVITLVKDKGLRHRLGARAAKKVQERHDISVAAPQLLKIIENLLEIPC